ncbi:mitochondrial import inner membrane translocase subunit PAM16 like 2-like, partial [Phalaenopsis equestris]|uniref:mitochondrial import inner membrane translocase subunit PAM16 like 2-like n=1 Tax=Phalaenopsis equestris TaxID=78828 RepID=UPI0009E18DA7
LANIGSNRPIREANIHSSMIPMKSPNYDTSSSYMVVSRLYSPSSLAAKLIANLLIMGSGILGRAVFQAYRKALERVYLPIFFVIIDILKFYFIFKLFGQRYDTLFERNGKMGSFYLQSKVHRAKECLEAAYQKSGEGTQ